MNSHPCLAVTRSPVSWVLPEAFGEIGFPFLSTVTSQCPSFPAGAMSHRKPPKDTSRCLRLPDLNKGGPFIPKCSPTSVRKIMKRHQCRDESDMTVI